MPICAIITSEQSLQGLADDWRQLQSRAGQSPFTDYDWFCACWDHLAKPQGKTLHIVTGHADGRLVAVLPLIVGKKQGFRILQGGGFDAFYPTEMLTESKEYSGALWQAAHQSRLYDFALIRDVDTASACSAALASFARRHDMDRAPYLKIIHKNGEEWLEGLPKKVRGEYRRRLRRLEEKGKVSNHVHTSGPVSPDILEGMLNMKKAWCIKNRKYGLFDHSGVNRFFDRLLTVADLQQQIVLSWIACEEHILGYNLSFIYKKKLYGYFVTYDTQWTQYSPGSTGMINAAMWAIDNGCHEFNLLQGEGRYKRDLTDNSREYAEWTFSSSAAGKLKEHLYIALRALKRKLASTKTTPSD